MKDRGQKLRELIKQAQRIADPELGKTANLCNILSLTRDALDLFWIGIYEVKGESLYLALFQGSIACNKIKLGEGVCGTVAKEGDWKMVDDVTRLENYIACHPETKSELVLPVRIKGKIRYVLDIDSTRENFFSKKDIPHFEKLTDLMAKVLEKKEKAFTA